MTPSRKAQEINITKKITRQVFRNWYACYSRPRLWQLAFSGKTINQHNTYGQTIFAERTELFASLFWTWPDQRSHREWPIFLVLNLSSVMFIMGQVAHVLIGYLEYDSISRLSYCSTFQELHTSVFLAFNGWFFINFTDIFGNTSSPLGYSYEQLIPLMASWVLASIILDTFQGTLTPGVQYNGHNFIIIFSISLIFK